MDTSYLNFQSKGISGTSKVPFKTSWIAKFCGNALKFTLGTIPLTAAGKHSGSVCHFPKREITPSDPGSPPPESSTSINCPLRFLELLFTTFKEEQTKKNVSDAAMYHKNK